MPSSSRSSSWLLCRTAVAFVLAATAAEGGGHQLAFGSHHHKAHAALNGSPPPDTGQAAAAGTGGQSAAAAQTPPADPYAWDGVASWEQEHPRVLYFEPFAGLGNRLRAVASAVVLAQEHGVELRVIWRPEESCGPDCNPGFNSTWPDLFSAPRLLLADNFPGSTYSANEEWLYLRAAGRNEHTPPLQPGQCLIHQPADAGAMRELLLSGWTTVGGREVLCVKSDSWLTEAAEAGGRFFFRLLRPSQTVAGIMQRFKRAIEWEQSHLIGVHVRRGDLLIWGTVHKYEKLKDVLPLGAYVDAMRVQQAAAVTRRRVRFFLATDDREAEAAILAAFPPGWVHTLSKTAWSRTEVAGTQQALADVMLLSECHALIGTFFSSFSATAQLMGDAAFMQVAPDLG